PEWYQPYNASHETQAQVSGRLSARTTNYNWRLQWAPGIEPAESDFQDITVSSASAPVNGTLGTIDLAQVRAALDARLGGGATVDPTAPAKGPGDKDPNEPAFTVRVVVTDSAGNHGEDRKVLFDYRDTTLHSGWAKDIHSGGEASPRTYDLDGDNKLDTIQ